MNNPSIINVFVRAAVETFEAELQAPVTRGQVTLTGPSDQGMPIIGLIGITGVLEGMVSLGVARGTACQIVSMMMGEEISEVTPLVESAVGEMCNVVAGRSSALLLELGYRVEITPPVIIIGDDLKFSMGGVPRLTVPFHTSFGEIELKIAFNLRQGPAAPSALNLAAKV